MAKKLDLAAALHQAAAHTNPESAAPAEGGGEGKPGMTTPSRAGLKTVAGHFDPAVSRQLRSLAVEGDTTLQELLREAINDLFRKHGRPPLA